MWERGYQWSNFYFLSLWSVNGLVQWVIGGETAFYYCLSHHWTLLIKCWWWSTARPPLSLQFPPKTNRIQRFSWLLIVGWTLFQPSGCSVSSVHWSLTVQTQHLFNLKLLNRVVVNLSGCRCVVGSGVSPFRAFWLHRLGEPWFWFCFCYHCGTPALKASSRS